MTRKHIHLKFNKETQRKPCRKSVNVISKSLIHDVALLLLDGGYEACVLTLQMIVEENQHCFYFTILLILRMFMCPLYIIYKTMTGVGKKAYLEWLYILGNLHKFQHKPRMYNKQNKEMRAV